MRDSVPRHWEHTGVKGSRGTHSLGGTGPWGLLCFGSWWLDSSSLQQMAIVRKPHANTAVLYHCTQEEERTEDF